MVSQTKVPQSGSRRASLTIRAASSLLGGSGFGVGAAGGSSRLTGFTATRRQRTARLKAPLRTKWICRIADADSGRHVCGRQRSSQSCSRVVRWSDPLPARAVVAAATQLGVQRVENVGVERTDWEATDEWQDVVTDVARGRC